MFLFQNWLMGRLYEEKDKTDAGGGGGGGAAGGAVVATGGAAGATVGTTGAQGGSQAGAGAAGGGQAGAVGTGAATGQQKPVAPKVPAGLVVDDDEDEEALKPGEDGLIKAMSPKAFMRRVSSMTKKELRKLFGTDDVQAIVKEREELSSLRKYKDDTEKEKLTTTERLQKEVEQAKKEAKEATDKAAAAELRAETREYTGKLREHLSTLVDKSDANDMLDKLARAVSKGHVKTIKEAKAWCGEYVEKHPKWKKSDGAAADKKDDKSAGKDDKSKDKTGADAGTAVVQGGGQRRRVPLSTTKRPGAPSAGNNGSSGDQPLDFRTASKQEIFEKTGIRL